MVVAGTLAALILTLSFSVFFVGRGVLHLPLGQLQTLVFLMLVFSGQGAVYLVRERYHFWHSRPSRWLLLSSALDIAAVSVLATQGILMAAISPALVGALLLLVLAFLTVVDFIKVQVFRRSGLH